MGDSKEWKLVQIFLERPYISRSKKCAHTFWTLKFICNSILCPRKTCTPFHIVILWVLLSSPSKCPTSESCGFQWSPGPWPAGKSPSLENAGKDGFQSLGGGDSRFYNSDPFVNTVPESFEAPPPVNLSVSISTRQLLFPFRGDNVVSIHSEERTFPDLDIKWVLLLGGWAFYEFPTLPRGSAKITNKD